MRTDERFPAVSHGIRSPWAAGVGRRPGGARRGGRGRWLSVLLLAGWSYVAYIMLLGLLLIVTYVATEQASAWLLDTVGEAAVIISFPMMKLFAFESHTPGVPHAVGKLVMFAVMAWAILGHWALGQAAVEFWRARRARGALRARLCED